MAASRRHGLGERLARREAWR